MKNALDAAPGLSHFDLKKESDKKLAQLSSCMEQRREREIIGQLHRRMVELYIV